MGQPASNRNKGTPIFNGHIEWNFEDQDLEVYQYDDETGDPDLIISFNLDESQGILKLLESVIGKTRRGS